MKHEAATLAYLVTEALPLVERENPQLGERLELGLLELLKAMRSPRATNANPA